MASKVSNTAEVSDAQEEPLDGPLLDTLGVAVKKLVARGKERGYITYDELNTAMPPDEVSSEQIEDTMSMLSEMGINLVESEEGEEAQPQSIGEEESGEGEVGAAGNVDEEDLGRTDDPVRMYLREMGSVELLSREGEIAIAKRIEAGRELMIGALCESPLTFEALTVWRDELNEGKVLLRDIIDLEAMYGAGPDGSPAPVPPPVGPDGKPLNNGLNNGLVDPSPLAVAAPAEFKKPDPPKPAPKPAPAPKAEGEEGEGGEAAAAADSQDD